MPPDNALPGVDEVAEILGRADLFQTLDPELIRTLAASGETSRAEAGRTLFLEGDEGDSFFILLDGAVKLYKVAPDGREIIVKLIQPGEVFAEVVLFEDDKYPVNAVAMVTSRTFRIHRDRFLHLLDDPAARRKFIAALMKKLRYMAGRMLYLTAYDVEERFFRFLEEQYGRRETYPIYISKKDLASAIGTIPETLSRLINRLKKRGVIEWDRSLKVKKEHWDDVFHSD
jgi:CRP/FNR family transcriptional regulator